MCASPGSKTSQLIEALHAEEGETGMPPSGVVVANDANVDRAYMLVHQMRRLDSPSLIVTTHKAQHFPTLFYSPGGDAPRLPDEETRQHRFDRILCDAPCSGDGTTRKSPNLYHKWTPTSGATLHPLQLSIAFKGVALLDVRRPASTPGKGGRAPHSLWSCAGGRLHGVLDVLAEPDGERGRRRAAAARLVRGAGGGGRGENRAHGTWVLAVAACP